MLKEKKTYLFNKPMIYKMVATLADFDPKYRALDEIVLDSSAMEAFSVANFSSMKTDGKYHTHPAYIDALSQSAGFVMNANDKSNLDLEVFVNHGWSSFQLFEDLSPNKHYETHVAMLESSGKLWKGDVLVLDGDKVVAIFGGIAVSPSLTAICRQNPHLYYISIISPPDGSARITWYVPSLTLIISCKVWHDDSSITYCRPRVQHKPGLKIRKNHRRWPSPLLIVRSELKSTKGQKHQV